MPKIPVLNPLLQAWLLEGPLSAQVPDYVERLRRGRYATHTSSRCLNGVAHFAHWMSMCHLPARMLDEGCIDQFMRKQRTMPLWRSTVKAVRSWLRFNLDLLPASALLPNRDGHTMTRNNVAQRLALAVVAATPKVPSLRDRHISPHTIRHTTAMHLLQSGEPIDGIALWLGHESPTTTHQYTEANLAMKEKALARMQDPDTASRRFRASDSLLEFLKDL
jgi:integrase